MRHLFFIPFILLLCGICRAQDRAEDSEYFYLNCDAVAVAAHVAEAVCAAQAETGWALETLNSALKSGQAKRLFSWGGVSGKGALHITQNIDEWFLTTYALSGHAVLPVSSDSLQQVIAFDVMADPRLDSPQIEMRHQLVENPVRSVTTPAGEVQAPTLRSGSWLGNTALSGQDGIRLQKGVALADGKIVVGVFVTKKFPAAPLRPDSAKVFFRLSVLRVGDGAFQAIKSSAASFPYLPAEAKSNLLSGATALAVFSHFKCGDAVENTRKFAFLSGYQASAIFKNEVAAPYIEKSVFFENASIESTESGKDYAFCCDISGVPIIRTITTKAGPVELPKTSSLSITGTCRLLPGEAMVLAETGDPVLSGQSAVFPITAAQPSVNRPPATDEPASGTEESSAPSPENAQRIIVILEAIQ